MASDNTLNLGYVSLTDSALLVAAKEFGYFDRYDLNVALQKEASWSNVRDKVAYGVLDGAQMLAPMPLAMSLGVDGQKSPTVTAFTMGLNGNAITVSNALYDAMLELEPTMENERPIAASALKKVIEARKLQGQPPLTFAHVYHFSSHHYLLRYWLAAAGIDPDNDLRLEVVPPYQMVSHLEMGRIDGYCVGDPWNSYAVELGIGHILLSSYEIWNNATEKVFGVSQQFIDSRAETHEALIMALIETAIWLDERDNRLAVIERMVECSYVDAPSDIMRHSMLGEILYCRDQQPSKIDDFLVFHRYAANLPRHSHASWYLSQMLRWGHVQAEEGLTDLVQQVYRPDLFHQAATSLGLVYPHSNTVTLGEHEGPWQWDGMEMGANRFIDHAIYPVAVMQDYLNGKQSAL